jgi:hypothetical protein
LFEAEAGRHQNLQASRAMANATTLVVALTQAEL